MSEKNSLSVYNKKRDFKKTPEPSAQKISHEFANKKSIFVVHKHHASHLHWDLRLEIDGVLKSWAVPKEPPIEPNTKRLAIRVEDHPLSYATFEGTIPEGNYGAGTVEIWDSGEFTLEKSTPKELLVEFFGKKLSGKYVLINTSGKNWLFFKRKGN